MHGGDRSMLLVLPRIAGPVPCTGKTSACRPSWSSASDQFSVRGEGSTDRSGPGSCRDQPRLRGGDCTLATCSLPAIGPTPLARERREFLIRAPPSPDQPRVCGGRPRWDLRAIPLHRTSPACAGTTSCPARTSSTLWDQQPRVPGDDDPSSPTYFNGPGPAPRARGRPDDPPRHHTVEGTSPAGAGTTTSSRSRPTSRTSPACAGTTRGSAARAGDCGAARALFLVVNGRRPGSSWLFRLGCAPTGVQFFLPPLRGRPRHAPDGKLRAGEATCGSASVFDLCRRRQQRMILPA